MKKDFIFSSVENLKGVAPTNMSMAFDLLFNLWRRDKDREIHTDMDREWYKEMKGDSDRTTYMKTLRQRESVRDRQLQRVRVR